MEQLQYQCFIHPIFLFWFLVTFGYEVMKILRNLCLHFARQDEQDGKNRKKIMHLKWPKYLPKTKRKKYGMNQTLLEYLLTYLLYLLAYFCIVIWFTENCITKLGKLNNYFKVYNVSVFRNWPNFAKGGVHKLRLQDEVGRSSKNVHFLSMYIP